MSQICDHCIRGKFLACFGINVENLNEKEITKKPYVLVVYYSSFMKMKKKDSNI